LFKHEESGQENQKEKQDQAQQKKKIAFNCKEPSSNRFFVYAELVEAFTLSPPK